MPRLSPAAPSQGVEQQQTVARLRIADVQDAQGNANTWCRGTPARYPIHDTAHKLTKPDESPRIGFEALSALAGWLGSRDERSAGVDLEHVAPRTTGTHRDAPGSDGFASDAQLTVFPAKAWFRDTPWEKLIKTVLRLERTVCKRAPATGLCAQTTEVVFWISSASNQMPRRWNEWIRAHWRIENGSHYVRDTAFAEDASRIRKNPDIAARLRSFAYNLIRAAGGSNIRNARWRAALDLNLILQLPRLH